MIRKIKKSRDSEGFFAAVLKGFSKAFDCILHELLLAKLNAYSVDEILNHIVTCVGGNKNKVGCTFSELMSILFAVP